MPINLLQYPLACVVGKPLPKAAFARHLEVSSALRRRMQEDVVSFSWLYKIAPTTLQVQPSATMPEIEIFLAALKSPDCPLDVFRFIDGALPQYIVFVLQYEERYRLLVNYKQWADADCAQFRVVQSFVSEWCSAAELSLPIEGNELPVIYEHFVRRIAGNALRPTSAPSPILPQKSGIPRSPASPLLPLPTPRQPYSTMCWFFSADSRCRSAFRS